MPVWEKQGGNGPVFLYHNRYMQTPVSIMLYVVLTVLIYITLIDMCKHGINYVLCCIKCSNLYSLLFNRYVQTRVSIILYVVLTVLIIAI